MLTMRITARASSYYTFNRFVSRLWVLTTEIRNCPTRKARRNVLHDALVRVQIQSPTFETKALVTSHDLRVSTRKVEST